MVKSGGNKGGKNNGTDDGSIIAGSSHYSASGLAYGYWNGGIGRSSVYTDIFGGIAGIKRK